MGPSWVEVPLASFLDLDRRAHATAWLAPLPPEPVEKDWDISVSPPEGRRVVRVIRSVFREPITVIDWEAIGKEICGDFVNVLTSEGTYLKAHEYALSMRV